MITYCYYNNLLSINIFFYYDMRVLLIAYNCFSWNNFDARTSICVLHPLHYSEYNSVHLLGIPLLWKNEINILFKEWRSAISFCIAKFSDKDASEFNSNDVWHEINISISVHHRR